MKITFLIHPKSWFKPEDADRFREVLEKYAAPEDIKMISKPDGDGDVMFALHYPALISTDLFSLHNNNVVIHAADLPKGRGRSPIHWQVEEGINNLVVTLFEMGDGADNGDIYLKSTLELNGTELLNEIRSKVIDHEIKMVDEFLSKWPVTPVPQEGEPSFYPKRKSKNQKLDVDKTIAEQFDKMRVADNDLYPLWFEHKGTQYEIKIEKK